MPKLLFSLLGIGFLSMTSAQTFTEWQDADINAVNRLPMRATKFAYESVATAAVGDKNASGRFLMLDGIWRFCWTRHADQRPADFFCTDYNDRTWSTMPVPGLWELNGYGDPQYVNVGYPWREQFANNPPEVPLVENHVGSYRRWIDIPAEWSGRQIVAHFGSATSNLYLWVNGRFVGYSEDSKLECEFDITRFVQPGKNLFAMQVFRWSDGTYLEDQDFFRLSGLSRESYLYARDKRHIEDVRLTPGLSENYTRGTLDVELAFPMAAKGCTAEVRLTAPDGAPAFNTVQRTKITGPTAHLSFDAGQIALWSAETPVLYTVTVTLQDSAGDTIEVIPLHTGFREVKVEDGQLLVNGKPVLLKGANRHEMDPDGGYVVSLERMIEDIRILKENNFNAVRTCHYPDDPRWYDLCDRYGIYLVAEANIESHGMGYDEKTLAKDPAYAKAHLERNERNVKRNINHPSVIVWSLGNEAGDGANFDACYDWVKAYDPTRPVQYERSEGGRNTDIVCPMYWTYDQCNTYLEDHVYKGWKSGDTSFGERLTKPLIQCEYAHAMGNSMGGFGIYWQMIRKYPHYQGGFIWDFVDQSLRKTGRNGAMIYGYGGDWNPYDASDLNFCDNGLISPDRVPNPHMYEVRYWQQPLWTELAGDNRTLSVFNENFFRTADNCYLRWTVLCDGEAVRSGIVADLKIAPQQSMTVALPFDVTTLPADGELLLNVEYRLKDSEPLLEPDHRIAYEQFVLRESAPADLSVQERMADRCNSLGTLTVRDNDRNYLIVESPAMRIDFRKSDGLMTRYEVNGKALLNEGAALEPDFWRAPTDNDFGAKLNEENRVWEHPGLRLLKLEHGVEKGIAVVTARYDMEKIDAVLTLEYRLNNAGEITVREQLTAGERTDVPDMMRFGMRMRMPAAYDRIDYYGRGPWENYADRKDAALLGRYRQTVDEQFYPYIRPQETGTKSDVRCWRQSDITGRGIEVVASEPFSASALNYSREALDEGLTKKQGHSQEIEPDRAVWLTIDKKQCGLGCIDSWGQHTQPEHRLPYKDYTFEFKITPCIR
ncbi:DUF4981 domain-containing protein [Alistipes onderdonkii]|jgi:putative exported beta-galactosidase|uniref:Beta-galactosidase n=1 Tax=Alistipes onderdonkii TaxID=328813 RepID=A0A5B3GXY3_9BACT|nr:glycoside hydrolase family 2 TIM barrel-domain containing protein [Alistipes onderdonkii]KAA2378598.1 DUF4981 domain-containing protein [Alistipes onderdonkii]KAA2381445.1 DUF4981 domain-containing protein [Alistipes onderdonkii]KAA2386132.1 DUF4981 domain-containing protein [Alistipes onderdonkii]KAA2389175.1 DUF4981 domain-containing protein [Alistipes onderdonkii]KAA2393456.1 DUF4981 domain-containing protein [Alistipes onderdonkii]